MIKTVFFGLLFILFGVALIFGSNFFKQDSFEAIQLVSKMDFVFVENGKTYDRRDTVFIFYYNDLVIYREQYQYEKYNKRALHGDTVVISDDSKTIDFHELRYDYYIWNRASKKGLKYGGDTEAVKVINVDSILIKKLFKNAKFYNIDYDKLETREFSADKSSFIEKYVCVQKPDESYCDTTYYTFSDKLSNIPFSLSKIADSLKRSKLIEVKYIYKFIPKGIGGKIDLPKREMIFKISKVGMDVPKSVEDVIQKFKKINDKN